MKESRDEYGVLVGNLREEDHSEDRDVDRRVILKWIFEKWEWGSWTGWIWRRMGTGGGGGV
jgi:hypothetical protein